MGSKQVTIESSKSSNLPSVVANLPIYEGCSGKAVSDLQRRLAIQGLSTHPDQEGTFGPGTRAGIEAFQHRRGLRIDGICGPQTWNTLVEAGFILGDRLLYLRMPMFRGDDVAVLQQRLSALGFDTGRVDGIFGELTERAVKEFQRNAGLPIDAIAGGKTLTELLRLQAPYHQSELISMVKAREELRQAPNTLTGRHLVIGENGGLGPAVAAIRRRLTSIGTRITELHHPDGSVQANRANILKADLFVGLRLEPDSLGCATSFYAGYDYESPGGKRLAELIQEFLPSRLGISDLGYVGMSVPILRETRMPAVIVEVGPPTVIVEHANTLAEGLEMALKAWVSYIWD